MFSSFNLKLFQTIRLIMGIYRPQFFKYSQEEALSQTCPQYKYLQSTILSLTCNSTLPTPTYRRMRDNKKKEKKGHPQRSCHQKQPNRRNRTSWQLWNTASSPPDCPHADADADGCEATITRAIEEAKQLDPRQCRQVCACVCLASPYVATAKSWSWSRGWD